jgi:hypothetical protein
MKNKKNKEKEAERVRVATYLIVFFLILFLFSRLISYFFSNGNEIERCKMIIFQDFREDCFQKIALQTKNISACNFTVNRDKCLTSIAIAQKNISICNLVGVGCVKSVVSLVSLNECLQLSSNLKDYCIFEKTLNSSNDSTCDLIINSSMKKLCKEIILQNQIINSKNFSLCKNLSGLERIVCLETVAKNLNVSLPVNYSTKLNYSNIYWNFSESDINNMAAIIKNFSIIGEAISTKNLSLCSTLPTNQSISCYLLFALNTTNISVCNYLPAGEVEDCKQLVMFYISKAV